jgi:hypothetical protein
MWDVEPFPFVPATMMEGKVLKQLSFTAFSILSIPNFQLNSLFV